MQLTRRIGSEAQMPIGGEFSLLRRTGLIGPVQTVGWVEYYYPSAATSEGRLKRLWKGMKRFFLRVFRI